MSDAGMKSANHEPAQASAPTARAALGLQRIEGLVAAGLQLDEPLRALIAERLQQAGKLGDALDAWSDLSETAACPANRVRYRLRYARLLVRTGAVHEAAPILERLAADAGGGCPAVTVELAYLRGSVCDRRGEREAALAHVRRGLERARSVSSEATAEGLATDARYHAE